MKITFREWLYIAITVIILSIGIRFIPLQLIDNLGSGAEAWTAFGTMVLAFATIILALFTWHSTYSANKREKKHREEELARENRDRKERQLKEIIEWAITIKECTLKPANDTFDRHNLIKGLEVVQLKSEYMRIQSLGIKDDKLLNEVEVGISALFNYIEELYKSMSDTGIYTEEKKNNLENSIENIMVFATLLLP